MATDVASHPVNGNHYGYNADAQQFNGNGTGTGTGTANGNGNPYANNNGTYSQAPPPSSTPATTATQQSDIPKDEVGWYFVEQYYTTLSRTPEKLYLYYNKRSQYVSGNETDKVQVCLGQRAINDRIKELDFQDCKVRITNVDSQASDINIVIQVIGEISNKSQPHRKFTQTFVLAGQTNGYFVLNDIFRYIIEEEEEEVAEPAGQAEEIQQAPAAVSGYQEPAPTAEEAEPKTLTSSVDPAAVEHDAKAVDKELEEKVLKTEPKSEEAPVAAVNGTSEKEEDEDEKEEKEDEVEETPAAPVAEEPTKVEEPEPVPEPAAVEEEKPKDPEPTPATSPPKQAPTQPAAPPKPAVPKTWASLAASAHSKVATPAAPAAPATQSQPKPAASKAALAPATTSTPATETSAQVPAATAAAQRDASPTANSGDEWTAVPSSHNRQQSRQVNGTSQADNTPNSRGYIKNVGQNILDNDLRSALQKFGDVTSFDISRNRNCAFLEYKTADAYNAAVAANPLVVGGEKLYVEERRIRQPGQQGYAQRGQFQGGRGGRGNFRGGERGGFNPRGGRGGARGRGDAQGA